MKKSILIVSLILLCTMLFSCTSDNNATPSETTPETTASIALFENGASEYTIVRPDEDDSIRPMAMRLKNTICEKFNANFAIATDFVPRGQEIPSEKKEILIGATNRPESAEALKGLPENSYVIKAINNKIVINAGSPFMLSCAISHFIETYVTPAQDKIVLTANLNDTADASAFKPKENADGSVTLDLNKFAITYDKDCEYLFIPSVANLFAEKAATLSPLVIANEDKTESPFEILFGKCDRDSYVASDRTHLFRDYSLFYKDGKLSVHAVSIYGYERAMRFLLEYYDEGLTIPADGLFSEYDYGTGTYAELYKNYENPYLENAWLVNVSHRGDVSSNLPENSLPSYQSSLNQKADVIETDLYLTSDKVWVICHDNTINRTTNGQGEINQMKLEEIKSYYLLEKNGDGTPVTNEKIPTLDEIIDLCHGKALFNLDKVSFGNFQSVYNAFEAKQAVDMAMFKAGDVTPQKLTEWFCDLMRQDRALPLFSPMLYNGTNSGLQKFRGLTSMAEVGRGLKADSFSIAEDCNIRLMCLTALDPTIDNAATWTQLQKDGYGGIMTDNPVEFGAFVHGNQSPNA